MNKKRAGFGAVALAFGLLSMSGVQAATEVSPENMTCDEFINLNPKAMAPIAAWMLTKDTVYKGGDSVDLQETVTVGVPQVITFCKQNPKANVYDFKDRLRELLAH